MKKTISLLLIISLITALTACGSAEKETTIGTSSVAQTEGTTPVKTEEATEAPTTEDEMAELSQIGEVEVENGILTVKITFPQDFIGETTQEELDKNAGISYISAKLNDDGSVTYKLTKAQHRAMMDSFVSGMDESFQELIEDETYSIADIKYNEDFTLFDVIMDGTELGFADSFTVIIFYMAGGMYGIFSGNSVDNVQVNFLDPDGNIIQTGNSSDMTN